MSDRPRWQHDALSQAMGAGKPPSDFSREGRIRLIAQFADDALAGRTPSWEAIMFACGGLRSWLETGGDLARDHWRVVKPKSRHTPSFIYRQLRAHPDERQDTESAAIVASFSSKNGCEK